MGYVEFLYGSGIICLPLNIPEKLHWQHLFEKPEEAETHRLYLSWYNTIQYPCILKNNIYHSNKRVPPSFFHSYTNPVFGHVLIHYFVRIHVLVVTEKLIWLLLLNILSFNFVPKLSKFLLGWQDSEEDLWSVMLSFYPATQVIQRFCFMSAALFKVTMFLFCICLSSMMVYLHNLFLLKTPLARMLLTPRWASRQKDEKMWNSYP